MNRKSIAGILILIMIMILVPFSPQNVKAQSATDIQTQIADINSQIASSTAMIDSLKGNIALLKKQLISLNSQLKNSPPTFVISDVPSLSSVVVTNGNGSDQSTLITATFNVKITGTSNNKTPIGLPGSAYTLVPVNASILSIYKNGVSDNLSNYNPVASYNLLNVTKSATSVILKKDQTITIPVTVKFNVKNVSADIYAVKLGAVNFGNSIIPVTGNLVAGHIPSVPVLVTPPRVSFLRSPTVAIIPSTNGATIANFSMSYDLTAGNDPIFISASSSVALKSVTTGSVGTISVVSFGDSDSTGDMANQYFYIAPGATKTFTVKYQSRGMPGTVAGTYQITGLNWGTTWSGNVGTDGGTLRDSIIGNTLFVNLSY